MGKLFLGKLLCLLHGEIVVGEVAVFTAYGEISDLGKLLFGKLAVGEIAVREIAVGEVVSGKM